MVFVRNIYKKFQKEGRTDDGLNDLMKFTSKRISFWNRIIAKIRKQMDPDPSMNVSMKCVEK